MRVDGQRCHSAEVYRRDVFVEPPSTEVCLAYSLGLANPLPLEGGPYRDVWPAPSASGFSERSLLPVWITA